MYRTVVDLCRPTLLLYLLVVLAVLNLWRKRQESRRRLLFATIPLLLLSVFCMPITTYFALGTLEWPYPPLDERPSQAQAIVVLSGDLRLPDDVRRKPELGEDTLYRCLKAVELYRQGKPCPVLVSGGPLDADIPGSVLAEAMSDFLVQQGVRPQDILKETVSQTTYENAVESACLLQQRNIQKVVLVTDANSLYRAERCFRKQGIDVIPCGCRYLATKLEWSPWTFVPNPAAARGWEVVWHEWLGTAWYALRGRI
jgi:uncharacterized SAM-binding protein YcdF (DUF218 family)